MKWVKLVMVLLAVLALTSLQAGYAMSLSINLNPTDATETQGGTETVEKAIDDEGNPPIAFADSDNQDNDNEGFRISDASSGEKKSVFLGQEKIDTVAFKGAYVINNAQAFVKAVQDLGEGYIAVIIAANDAEYDQIMKIDAIKLPNVRLMKANELTEDAQNQWAAFQGDMFDPAAMDVNSLTANRAIVKDILKAK